MISSRKMPLPMAVGDLMRLGMQDFDPAQIKFAQIVITFAQISPKFVQILPKLQFCQNFKYRFDKKIFTIPYIKEIKRIYFK